MRHCLALSAWLLLAFAARGQDSKKDLSKDSPSSSGPTEIGGKTLEQWIKDIPSKDRSKGENAIRTVLYFPADRAYAAVPVLLAELKKNTFDAPIDTSIRVNIPIALGV